MSTGPVQPCTNVGQPGTKVTLPTPIPENVTCTLMGYTQAASTITVSVISNTTGNAVATISGTGTTPTVMSPSIATFSSGTDTYYLSVTSNSGQTASVIIQYLELSYSIYTYAGAYAFIVEDSPQNGDCDFNDCTGYITWNLLSG